MIIQYDTRPDATVDQKLRSLIDSIQLALSEAGIDTSNVTTSQEQDISAIISEMRELRDAVNTLTAIVTEFDDRLVGVEDGLETVNNTLETVQESIDTINGNITDLDARVTALEHSQTP